MKCKNCGNLVLVKGDNDPYYWCDKVDDSPVLDMERECEYYIVATGGDLIRRMTDDELCNLIQEFNACPTEIGNFQWYKPCDTKDGVPDCVACARIAIISEVEE